MEYEFTFNLGPDPITFPLGTIATISEGDLCEELASWLHAMPHQLPFVKARGRQIPRERNLCVKQMRGAWLLFVDADIAPPLDLIPQLWRHGEPVVGAVCLSRYAPFEVCANDLDGHRLTVGALPKQGLLEVSNLGTGCLLIRREVLDTVGAPWFQCGQIISDMLLEDSHFIKRVREAGFPVYLDCGLRAKHRTSGMLYAGFDGQVWVDWPGPLDLKVPQTPGPFCAHCSAYIAPQVLRCPACAQPGIGGNGQPQDAVPAPAVAEEIP